ncbi:hypothetical protein H0266_04795 [Halobacillus locisalis]|uniref:DUF4367 domain-containing protein n=1 Tax=Halobacillus locisalis TaxID=220753 RepID=A0A838CQQ7_9BACI|nr:hypothetical protein [Halobacillus locisalis]MBA2174218.1 hypothetical protein [Halobacillus locisalis]
MLKRITPLLFLGFLLIGCSGNSQATDTYVLQNNELNTLLESLEYTPKTPSEFPFKLESVDSDIDPFNGQLNIHIRNEDHGVIDVFIVEGPVEYKGEKMGTTETTNGKEIDYVTRESEQKARWQEKGIHYQISSLSFEGQRPLTDKEFFSIIDHFE